MKLIIIICSHLTNFYDIHESKCSQPTYHTLSISVFEIRVIE